MDGLAALGARIAEINGQLARLSAPAVAQRVGTTARSTGASTATAPATTSTTAASGSAGVRSFDDVLASALSAAPTTAATAATATTTAGAISTASTSSTPRTLDTGRTRVAEPSVGSVGSLQGMGATTGPGRLTRTGAPVELAKYGNGRIPASALEPIGRGHRLWAPAAEAFQRLRDAATKAGVHIGVTDSYRSYAQQVDVARRKGLHSQGGLAARPGTSEHGWGKSLDLDLHASALRWMRRHADEFGFTENVSREPWHWTYAAR
jgi:zinc D-Ala-D-Ala carboxypeptidase